ncbi:MAG TPA: hypothetical protein VGN23_16855 [Verrucomicrobiae bacterium]|jgi:spermidine synthase
MRAVLFFLFFVSGFAGLVYQVVWTRLAFASFGIITPVLSVVLSVFMLGLSLGAVAGGRWISRLTKKTRVSAIWFYALAEFLIGLGAFIVPALFDSGERVLLVAGQMNSFGYLFLSALVLGFSILPWCFLMGTTFPFMMAFIREQQASEQTSFSFLYVANVFGAMCGTFLTAIAFIELFGFRYTLHIAAAGNFLIALICIFLASRQRNSLAGDSPQQQTAAPAASGMPLNGWQDEPGMWILFSTGFCAMAMEVVWYRAFTPVLKTQVYSFALIVFAYLGATFIGSLWYRLHLQKGSIWPVSKLMALLVIAALLPVAVCDPRLVKMDAGPVIYGYSAIWTLASICPFCAILGYLTPCLIDRYSAGDPARAGKAYAINVLGCILGPLVASYLLLPRLAERYAIVLLCVPFFLFYFDGWKRLSRPMRLFTGPVAGAIVVYALFFSQDFDDLLSRSSVRMDVRRDYAASVVALQSPTEGKLLFVNSIGMTILTPVTKMMADLPLAFHKGDPQSALIICFGMGTSYRSALSWGIKATVVELVPDVPKEFGFYHDDAQKVLNDPHGRVVIDDGRRFLRRTQEKYDVIVTDPPPPPETAGSSLLYTPQFYDLIKQHLNPGGILQVWYPGGEKVTQQAVVRSVVDSFPYVRCFPAIDGTLGIHLLASMQPIEKFTPAQLAAHMPKSAQADMLEWSSIKAPAIYLGSVVMREIPLDNVLSTNSDIPLTDDDPINEYFLLRQIGWF